MVLPVLTVASAALVVAAGPRAARACGGCFAPTDTVTAVESHRMVVLLGAERSVLWDQLSYTGNPADFVWVLPVPSPEAVVEEDVVVVYAEGVVGPYETAVIGSEDAGALRRWLVEHDYRVPESTLPIIEHYVEQSSAFVVLRLSPDQGVQSMQPVRVSYPGYMARLPLAMVTVGAAGELGLSLWIIAAQRFEARNYRTVAIDRDLVVFDWNTSTSNYDEAFAGTIEAAGGGAWVVEYAHAGRAPGRRPRARPVGRRGAHRTRGHRRRGHQQPVRR